MKKQNRLEAFLREKAKLLARQKRTPELISHLYELYLVKEVGLVTQLESVYPESAAAEAFNVKQLLKAMFLNPLFSQQDFREYVDKMVIFPGSVLICTINISYFLLMNIR